MKKRDTLEKLLDKKVFKFIDKNIDFNNNISILETKTLLSVEMLDDEQDAIINVERINNVNKINKYLEKINTKLKQDGMLIGCVETYDQRFKRIIAKHNKIISYPLYSLDFLLKRVFPKLKFTRYIYFVLTQGNNRAISLVETYGRLYSCGFEFMRVKVINNITYFVFRKFGEPKYNSVINKGVIMKLPRIGKDGKIIIVRKLRTMYAFSEYLQDYVFDTNQIDEGGKFKNDFRITFWGRILREFWIDELPMIWNWIKGEMSIVGVRPLSEQYYNMYEDDLKAKRIKYKPGLVPPYYADMPKSLKEIMDSERKYLDAYALHPLKTQWSYFRRAFVNIVFKRARSK